MGRQRPGREPAHGVIDLKTNFEIIGHTCTAYTLYVLTSRWPWIVSLSHLLYLDCAIDSENTRYSKALKSVQRTTVQENTNRSFGPEISADEVVI